MSISISLDKEKYVTFMNIMSIMRGACTDICIEEGHIFQFNDQKSILYDIDLKELIGENTLYIKNIKDNFDLLDIFRKQLCDVVITITEKKYTFSDKSSKVEMIVVDKKRLVNQPENHNSTRALAFKSIDEDSTILYKNMDQFMLERLMSISQTLKTNTISFQLLNGTAILKLLLGDKTNAVSSDLLTLENINYDKNGVVEFPVYPLLLNTKNTKYMNVSLYNTIANDGKLILHMNSSIGTDPTIELNMWGLNKFLERAV